MKLQLLLLFFYLTFGFGSLAAFGTGNHNETGICMCGIRNPTNVELFTACFLSQKKDSQQLKRVINGDIVNPPYKYPWMVALYKNRYRCCTGSLISRHYVITAAHCVKNWALEGHISHTTCYDKKKREKNCWKDPKDITVAFVTQTGDFTKQMSVDQITVNPKYRVKSILHDLAILRLTEPGPCDTYRRPICISHNIFDYKPDVEATLVGYGLSSMKKGESTPHLREGKMKSMKITRCASVFKHDTMCFKGVRDQGSCAGDSGAPLAFEKDGVYYLIGVLSAGDSKCAVSQPSYYSSIEKHSQWIQSQIKELPSAPSGTARSLVDCKKGK